MGVTSRSLRFTDSCLHQVLFNEHKSFTHASRGPNHFASSFFDSHGEIESDKRLVFDNQYRDLIQQRSSPRGTSLPWPAFANNLRVA
jgi:hypothetical protein